ncbi:WAP domain-containing protein [Trichonephila inaurata madagascariensis]|uniref:WAP domain-containing protein n=1 Tax=Trichonephila inaurata madagascariensis TaxID=2747483 RepID=A0A8X6XEW3_9ARAC|nr:WAP domain-containing protein [Trichonephila inaurata madagascariensis]
MLCVHSSWNSNTRSIAMLAFFLFLSLIVGPAFSQNKPFPFGPRRRILPGQRSSGCSDCAAELKQCILTCVEKFDCSEMNVKGKSISFN